MIVEDQIYGRTEIAEPLLVDLIGSPPVERLRGVHMGGITALLGISPTGTRHEHSLGAMLLVRRLGGSVHEQAAALLHDVSHTALSHVVDYLFDTPSRQAFHDDQKGVYVENTVIPEICAGHGTDWRALIEEARWPLLEQDAPRLCADRIDYTWRDVEALGVFSVEGAREVTAALRVHDGRIAIEGEEPARAFAEAYIACDELCWCNPRGIGLYELTARALRRAIEVGAINREDLWGSDEELWDTLGRHPDAELRRRLAVVSPETGFELGAAHGDIVLRPKVRIVDPDVVTADGALRPLSALDRDWAVRRDTYMSRKAGEWRLRLTLPSGDAPKQL
jgi:HD superfamily phosphohydrolase